MHLRSSSPTKPQAERSATAYVDYVLPFFPDLSVNLGIQYLGKRAGSVDNLLTVPGRTLVNAGSRYRFTGHF